MNRSDQGRKSLFFSLSLRSLTQSTQYFYYILMPFLVVGLNATPQAVKLTVAFFFLGLAVSILFSGPLIDLFGVRKNFWLGVIIFSFGTAICLFAGNVYTMIIGRFVQGFAVGIIQTLSKSLLATSKARATYFAIAKMVRTFAAPLAMLLTSLIIYFFSWRASFIFLLLYSFSLLAYGIYWMEDQEPNIKSKFREQLKLYWMLIREKGFIPNVVSYALVSSLLIPFYVTATYTLVHILNYPAHVVGLMATILAVIKIMGALLSLYFIKKEREQITIWLGFLFSIFGCFLMVALAFLLSPSFSTLVIPMAICVFGINLLYATFNTNLLNQYEHVSKNITISSAAICCALVGAISSAIASFHGHHNLQDTSILMFGMALASVGLYKLG